MFFSFRQPRRQLLAEPFPESWLLVLHRNVFPSRLLLEPEQAKFRDTVRILVAEKTWVGCAGFQITDEVRVTIAAQACLLLLGFEAYYFDQVTSILVYPGRFLAGDPSDLTDGSEHRLGEAHPDGPVVLSWWDACWDGRRHGNRNLVIHEFAHQLAALGDPLVGRPPLDDPDLERSWQDVMEAEFARLTRDVEYDRPTLLDPYGASNRAEFFAVASECFFQQPVALRRDHPPLYQILAEFYRQNPAARRTPEEEDRAEAERAEAEYTAHALEECNAALRSSPDSREAYSRRAAIYANQGEYDQAIADSSEVIRLAPHDDSAYYERGAIYRSQGCLDLAIADFSTAIRLCPGYAWAYYERAVAHAEKGDLDQAVSDLTRAVRADPNHDRAYDERGRVYHDQGEYKKAVADFTRAIRLCPRCADYFSNRASSLIPLGEYDRAITDCDRALELDPDVPEPYKHRGVARHHKGDYEQAIADCTEAIRLDPEDAEAFRARGDAYAADGQEDEARKDHARADELISRRTGAATAPAEDGPRE
jgi:Mlc titration factor MtfA (ptsG expression regulator)/Tfp pilus assembly protein PilF